MPAMRFCSCSARLRSVSRSSPKILSAICARTPESMWSRRCEIGWPTLTVGRQHGEARADVGDDLLAAAARPLQVDVDLGRVHAFGMLVELGAAGAAADGASPPAPAGSGARRSGRRDWIRPARCPAAAACEIVSVPSLKGGRKERGRNGDAECGDRRPRTTAATMTNACCPKAQSEQTPVAGLEAAHEPGVAVLQAAASAAAGSSTAPASP